MRRGKTEAKKTSEEKKEIVSNTICWTVIGIAVIYFSYQILMGIASKWYILFA